MHTVSANPRGGLYTPLLMPMPSSSASLRTAVSFDMWTLLTPNCFIPCRARRQAIRSLLPMASPSAMGKCLGGVDTLRSPNSGSQYLCASNCASVSAKDGTAVRLSESNSCKLGQPGSPPVPACRYQGFGGDQY